MLLSEINIAIPISYPGISIQYDILVSDIYLHKLNIGSHNALVCILNSVYCGEYGKVFIVEIHGVRYMLTWSSAIC